MSKYLNANKIQVMLQNPKVCDPKVSDAPQYSHGYAFAMGIPFAPVMFQSVQDLDPAGRSELKNLIQVYKSQREDIFTSTTFPLGNEPDNMSWTGFQMVSNSRQGGHLLLFRELHNPQPNRALQLKFLAGKKIEITDLISKKVRTAVVSNSGACTFSIPTSADYRFYRYEII